MSRSLVWYLAYGSNLCRARFDRYLAGGSLPGTVRTYEGARDPRPPRADRSLEFEFRLRFAGTSPTWGGGTAFLDPIPADGRVVLARAWLITVDQLADVAAQESRRDRTPVDPAGLRVGETRVIGPGRYDLVVGCGELDGDPVVALTAPPGRPDLAPNPPVAAYRALVAAGLAEAHGCRPDQADAYIDGWL